MKNSESRSRAGHCRQIAHKLATCGERIRKQRDRMSSLPFQNAKLSARTVSNRGLQESRFHGRTVLGYLGSINATGACPDRSRCIRERRGSQVERFFLRRAMATETTGQLAQASKRSEKRSRFKSASTEEAQMLLLDVVRAVQTMCNTSEKTQYILFIIIYT